MRFSGSVPHAIFSSQQFIRKCPYAPHRLKSVKASKANGIFSTANEDWEHTDTLIWLQMVRMMYTHTRTHYYWISTSSCRFVFECSQLFLKWHQFQLERKITFSSNVNNMIIIMLITLWFFFLSCCINILFTLFCSDEMSNGLQREKAVLYLVALLCGNNTQFQLNWITQHTFRYDTNNVRAFYIQMYNVHQYKYTLWGCSLSRSLPLTPPLIFTRYGVYIYICTQIYKCGSYER